MSKSTAGATGAEAKSSSGLTRNTALGDNDILNIVEGAEQRQESALRWGSFVRSNARHRAADVFLALSTYTFSGLLHVHGQSTALTCLSLWAAGTTFLLNMQVRKVFDMEDAAKRRQVVAEINLQEVKVFQLEMVASWVWMLSSMQQFKVHRRMKYCGYSSWMGFGSCVYFTLRHMYNVLLVD